MYRELKCITGCCILRFSTKSSFFKKEWKRELKKTKNLKRQSAGIAIIAGDKLLITQSYNNFWGVPKGKKENETIFECASREVIEESGISIQPDILESCEELIFKPNYDKKLTIHIFKHYMSSIEYIIAEMIRMNIKDGDLHKDSTGFGWIKIDCLKQLTKLKIIKLNALTRFLIKIL
jgi:ADP-ribose pyrophosphatase YjhB (NUDIX family)